ncbi:ricin-type beta-trefoil lectin domain protein [Catenuloplanes sp. NPDC051500]|uniref:ricin-type beta-trefoil lectin domain protein n=1 Tax=Catenuloplanes sp. NPDC051500 TaxID=3363959 RepID=UPI00379A669B
MSIVIASVREALRRRPVRRGLAAAAVLGLVVAGGVTGSISGTATAQSAKQGVAVPAGQVPMIAQAALACPSLTPARLAGQLMAASRFEVNAINDRGGSGLAGLSEAAWGQWAPWPEAKRLDPEANVFALAHHMCDLVGQIRHADIGGSLWELALGSYHSGFEAVRRDSAVPAEAAAYVTEVAAYAAWYADRAGLEAPAPEASSSEAASAPDPETPPAPVPDAYVQLVVSAGAACPAVSAPKIAAQLMAASAFNPNLLGPSGGEGIAQFLPAVWARYGQAGASPWDPSAAIPTLGRTMCALTAELAGLAPDPYPVALAAFQWGPTAVQEAAGVPNSPAVKEFASRVLAYTAYYATDPRLGAVAAPPPPAAPAPPSASPTRSTTATAPPAPPAAATSTPATVKTTTATKTTAAAPPPATVTSYQIDGYADKCIDAPAAKDGTKLQLWTCTGGADQKFTFPGDGTIRHQGLCIDLALASSDNGTAIQLAKCNGGWAQRFKVNESHDLVNTAIGKCVDVADWDDSNGARLQLWECNGETNQKWWRT